MPRLDSAEILNAASGNALISVPIGGVFILKQLLAAEWIGWDTEEPSEVDTLKAILAKTIRLAEGETVTERSAQRGVFSTQTRPTSHSLLEFTIGADGEVFTYQSNQVVNLVSAGWHRITASVKWSGGSTANGQIQGYIVGNSGVIANALQVQLRHTSGFPGHMILHAVYDAQQGDAISFNFGNFTGSTFLIANGDRFIIERI